MRREHVTLPLELRLADDVRDGIAFREGGPATPFSSWLGLMSALETLSSPGDEVPANVDH